MSASRIGFKRMVVGLPQSVANHTAMNATADLAEFLHIDFLGTFVADPAFVRSPDCHLCVSGATSTRDGRRSTRLKSNVTLSLQSASHVGISPKASEAAV